MDFVRGDIPAVRKGGASHVAGDELRILRRGGCTDPEGVREGVWRFFLEARSSEGEGALTEVPVRERLPSFKLDLVPISVFGSGADNSAELRGVDSASSLPPPS